MSDLGCFLVLRKSLADRLGHVANLRTRLAYAVVCFNYSLEAGDMSYLDNVEYKGNYESLAVKDGHILSQLLAVQWAVPCTSEPLVEIIVPSTRECIEYDIGDPELGLRHDRIAISEEDAERYGIILPKFGGYVCTEAVMEVLWPALDSPYYVVQKLGETPSTVSRFP
ncbi:MAG: hypothetical protein IPM33_08355 [Phycisphaerales bacterium]|nr:hypothetical protein [Phycisphaerales bacterium]